MQDIPKQVVETLDQRASAEITIVDYTQLALKTVTLDGNALVEGTDWNAATDEDTTATSLANALNALAGFNAAAVGAVVTVYYDTPGIAGNSKLLTTDALVAGLTLSDPNLAGGVAATYSDIFDYDTATRITGIESGHKTTALSGSAPTLDIIHEVSFDKENWFEQPFNFTQITSAPAEELTDFKFTALHSRWKYVLGGDAYNASFTLWSVVK